jgi:hypothetical protein
MFQFHGSSLSDSPALRAQINFFLYFPYFLTDLDQNWCEKYAHIDVENL